MIAFFPKGDIMSNTIDSVSHTLSNVNSKSAVDDLAKKAVTAILNGNNPLDVDPATLGEYGECYTELYRNWKMGGLDAARKAFAAYEMFDGSGSVKRLLAGDRKAGLAVNGSSDMPPLPQSAWIDPSVANNAAPWLDEYAEYSRKWSPRSFDGYHEAIGLWLLSTVAAGRVEYHFGGVKRTSLYFALLGGTTIYAKTTAAKVGKFILKSAGLSSLLTPDEMTPQAFVDHLSNAKPSKKYTEMTSEERDRFVNRLRFSGQRGWYYDEFGQKVAAMMRDGGHMADYRGLLRRFDDAEDSYEYHSIGRGVNKIDHPYLALLANMTPADLQPYAGAGAPLWRDGTWARFTFISPPVDDKRKSGRFPDEIQVAPSSLISPLIQWHQRLGMPNVELDYDEQGEIKSTRVDRHDVPTLRLGIGVRDAAYAYGEALLDIANSGGIRDIDGNYGRLPETALRVAAIFASLQGESEIQIRHWARAQQLAEKWRQYLHNLYRALTTSVETSKERTKEDAILTQLAKRGALTKREITQHVRGLSSAEAEALISAMTKTGVIVEISVGRTAKYSLASQVDE